MIACPAQAKATLETKEDVTEALYEMSWLDYRHAEVSAQCKAQLNRLQEEQQAKFLLEDGTPIIERRKVVYEAIAACAATKLKGWLPKDKKSLELPHGTLSLRSKPIGAALQEGVVESDVITRLNAKTGFRAKLIEILDKAFNKLSLGLFLEFKPQLSFSRINAALKDGRLTQRQLAPFGLQLKGGDDELSISPAKFPVDQHDPQ